MKTAAKNPNKTLSKGPTRRKRRESRFLQFNEARGKTVEFIQMFTDADFPGVEIGFADKTALHFLMGTRLTMEPTYSKWKAGNQRVLRKWPAVECR
jgi:hypothetical protein